MNKHYQQRISIALTYIEQHLSQPLTLDIIATHCYFSPFHFHRVFRGVMNETLNDYISRRRLEVAINKLIVRSDLTITHIAFQCGFSSSANFSKAFKKYFGYTPSDIRAPKDKITSQLGKLVNAYGKDFHPSDLYPKKGNSTAQNLYVSNVLIKDHKQQQVCKLKSTGGYAPEALFQTWDNLSEWGEGHGIARENQYQLALCYDNPAVTPIAKCRYEASIIIEKKVEIAPPFEQSIIPAGTYASVYIKGSAEDVNNTQMALFSHWLPNSGYEPDNFPMLEHYLNDVRIDGFIELDLRLKIKSFAF